MSQDDLSRAIHAAEAAMQRRMRQHMGSPSEQWARLERTIEALGQYGARGIDRSACQWWRGSRD